MSAGTQLVGVGARVSPEIVLLLRRHLGCGFIDVLGPDAVVRPRGVRVSLVRVTQCLLCQVKVVARNTPRSEHKAPAAAVGQQIVKEDADRITKAREYLLQKRLRGSKALERDVKRHLAGVLSGLKPAGRITLNEGLNAMSDTADLEIDVEVLDDLMQVAKNVGLSVVGHVVEIVQNDQRGPSP
jgi:hypothetical protein